MKRKLSSLYKKLYISFGRQHWWPAESPFEVMVGAILTQNTSWRNVEKAIANLKQAKVLSPQRLHSLSGKRLARLIRPAGFFNLKTKRLKEFLKFYLNAYSGEIQRMREQRANLLRHQLLLVKGIGKETADSILLYSVNKPVFVVDAYTKRILLRHGLINNDYGYDQIQNLFMQNLKNEVKLFNEYHALLVKLGKDFCLKRKPKCGICPVKEFSLAAPSRQARKKP